MSKARAELIIEYFQPIDNESTRMQRLNRKDTIAAVLSEAETYATANTSANGLPLTERQKSKRRADAEAARKAEEAKTKKSYRRKGGASYQVE